ncbi:MAG: prolyl oligopeptidase family serine peptidase [Gemmatimonadaceae bacterium]
MNRRLAAAALVLAAVPFTLFAQQNPGAAQPAVREAAAGTRQFAQADLKAWKTFRSTALSADGKWFAYVISPNEGDASVVITSTADTTKQYKFGVGEIPQGGGGGAPQVASSTLTISNDSKWAAFTIYPTQADARRARTARRPLQNKVAIVNLATGEKKEFDKMRRFVFAGDAPQWIAFHGYSAGAAAAPAAPAGGAAGPAPAASDAADLILYALGNGTITNVGNVSEFGFDRMGNFLAYTIDARDQIGNGVQLRDLRTDVVKSLDSDNALYRRLAWVDSGNAFAVLRGMPDTVIKDTLYSVLAFTGIGTPAQKKVAFNPAGRPDFPAGMKVGGERAPRLSEDYTTVFFGIKEARKAEPRATVAGGRDSAGAAGSRLVQAGAPGAGGNVNQPRVDPSDENSSLIIWHAKDPRLQSQQIVQENADRSFTYLSEYRLADNKFFQLANEEVRSVTLMPKDRYAIGNDVREYEQSASYSGRRYADVYAFDLVTGQRKLVSKKLPASLSVPSPDGKQVLYWGPDGHYYVLELASGASRNITKSVPTSFVDVADDHNNIFPPAIFPTFFALGWSKDNANVLLSDGWDVWKVPVAAGAAVNLTVDGKANQVRYQRRYVFEPRERGIDLTKPMYFATYGEWTKKEGLARVEPGKAGVRSFFLDDARYNFSRARDADVFVFTRQTAREFPNYHVAGPDFRGMRQVTDLNPQQKEFAWTPGVRLVNYTSDKGDKLQGALYLPANYEPGRKYPLLVTIYEKRSQLAHQFVSVSETSTPNRSLYTSRGYAVLDPDIVYKVNDPGMSAVWSVLPAVKAAIATGIVDSSKVGLWGHSWGGYQTSHLVTQTKMFKAAIAGAPLTDLVSMYSSIYWNTGGTNQAIFESSQGRFEGNFIDNYDAYIRNSPAFHAKNVETPLIILHNDKDGAVDFNQGITYYNTLRQLGKDVILLEYVGENHGLARPVNQKDYALRMGEWFDHYLKGVPAPEWMVKGVPRIKMEEHLKSRKEPPKPALIP